MSETTEKLIRAIHEADEIEILEFDFHPCYAHMREQDARIEALEIKIQEAKNCLVCAGISDPMEVCENTLAILDSITTP